MSKRSEHCAFCCAASCSKHIKRIICAVEPPKHGFLNVTRQSYVFGSEIGSQVEVISKMRLEQQDMKRACEAT